MKFRTALMLFSLLTQTACSVFGIRSEETPSYKVLLQEDQKEIRSYESYVVAKTVIKGDYGKAQSEGFRILAGYIFGSNEKKQNISMTAPVVQKNESERISMTAPVSQIAEGDSWVMTFMMPSQYKLTDLPTPKDSRVILEEIPAKTIASLRYSGGRGVKRNSQKAEELREWLKSKNQYSIVSGPSTAGYDPPWTLPFLRRNEVHFEIKITE